LWGWKIVAVEDGGVFFSFKISGAELSAHETKCIMLTVHF